MKERGVEGVEVKESQLIQRADVAGVVVIVVAAQVAVVH